MAYTALYRKFRPITFSEMVGQEHITKTLRNQIIAGRVGHAYLFNGGRGTGKTSAAKVLARAINCLNPQEGEPCNECEICKAALSGSLTDIVEMDAASNNSVEDIRQIRDEVNFLPTLAKYRVYIIDEVHMLSTGAFNALLKTLEEPPAHVKFILATTEPQKLPATILSRCQRFDFKKISEEDIIKRLTYVCEESHIEITKGALKIIASLAEGAMRDALSILERCLQEETENTSAIQIGEEKVRDLVGIPKMTYIHHLTEAILTSQVEEAMKQIDLVIKEGKDIQNLLWELIKYSKDILVYQTSQELAIYNEQEIEHIKELAQKADKQKLFQVITELSNLENEMKWSSQKLILFQVGIIKLANGTATANKNGTNQEWQQMKQTIQTLQQEISQLKQGVIHNSSKNVEKSVEKPVKKEIKPKEKILLKPNETLQNWQSILAQVKQAGKIVLYTNLINTKAYLINDMTVGIEFLNGITPFVNGLMEKAENRNELERLISIECGKTMRIKLIDSKQIQQTDEPSEEPIEKLAQDYGLPLQIIEE